MSYRHLSTRTIFLQSRAASSGVLVFALRDTAERTHHKFSAHEQLLLQTEFHVRQPLRSFAREQTLRPYAAFTGRVQSGLVESVCRNRKLRLPQDIPGNGTIFVFWIWA